MIFRGDIQVMPIIVNDEKVTDNLLLPTGSEQQPANYIVTVYGAYGITNASHGENDNRRYNKAPDSFVKVSFCGLSVKTAVQFRNNHPMYYEQINIVEMFPNMSEVIRLEVCSGDGCCNRILATASLKLSQISHDGENGFLPTFGPSLLHMYGTTSSGTLGNSDEGPYHRGAMLLSLRTVVPYYQQELRSTNVEPVAPLRKENFWLMEDFCLFCPILEASMLDKKICGKVCGVAMTVGEVPSDDHGDEEFRSMMSEIRSRKLYYTGSINVINSSHGFLDFDNTFPVLQMAIRLPDFRFRMYRNNMVRGIVTDLDQALIEIERRFKNAEYNNPKEVIEDLNRAADDTAGNILKFLDILQYSSNMDNSGKDVNRYSTELDHKQLALQKEEAEKIYEEMIKRTKCDVTPNLIRSVTKMDSATKSTKKEVKILMADLKGLAENLKNIIYKTSEGWPDIVVWLLNGGSRVAYSKIPIADVIHSVIPEQSGQNCGRIQTIYLKPLKCTKHINSLATSCYCIAGKIELIMWMGLYRQIHAFENCLPKGYKLKSKDYDMCIKSSPMVLECRVFIFRAKINTYLDKSNETHTFVRVHTLNSVTDTKPKPYTTAPIWNQVLKIRKMVPATPDRVSKSPPNVLVEVYEDFAGKPQLVGRFEVEPVLEDRPEYEYAPKLQWYDLRRGLEHTGQILLSVQLLQIPETLLKSTTYTSKEETCLPMQSSEANCEAEELEPLPSNLVPKSTTYKVDIYWWGLRDVTASRKPCVVMEIDDLIIKSEAVSDKKSNCNFINGRSSQTLQAPLCEVYSPPLNIRLYDSSTFGRTLFLGTNVVKNPSKYLVSWLPEAEREASLKTASITASDFFQVNQVLYVKKSGTSVMEYDSKASVKTKDSQKTKQSRWKKLFSRKEENEEEYVLLPISSKEDKKSRVVNFPEVPEYKDWWMGYFSSLENEFDNGSAAMDKITIYPSELESQPNFSKFKDWCTTLKLYNGKKTGIPEKDEQLHCGFLKAGIAIYRWPPPENTIAVSYNGVNLKNGYFNDHPTNDPSKYLVRVYLVKGINLVAKAFSGMLDPYVAISCGNKHLGDRKSYVKNTLNPTFGKMYEFRCTLPDDYLLTVGLYDYDTVPPDELIGSTTIDLEDRIYTKHRGRIGLATEYNSTGPNKWRDSYKPSVILEELCAKNHLPPPLFPNSNTVVVNGVEYRDKDNTNNEQFRSPADKKESICLSLLHKWHTLPLCGYHLVPEHVETRTLYNNDKPGYEMGKLQMWIDIFPLDAGIYVPPAVDITPRKLEDYELRVIVWDLQGIRSTDRSKKVSNIYCRAWVDTIEQAQYTDVHYGTIESECSFNWRMIFRFLYHHAEKKMVRKEKGPFTEVEEHFPPIFVVQVLDSDAQTPDDFLGSLSFNLNTMPKGVKFAHQCKVENINKSNKINLFSVGWVRAWWPLVHTSRNTGISTAAGKIDLELSLLPKEKAIMMPVGLGREPPSPLPMPKRTAPSNPFYITQSIHLVWKRGNIIMLVVMVVLLIILLALYFEIPNILWKTITSTKRFRKLKIII
ncbi:unnamed protein product [Arctia plantaginis]|uniref:C2 domain-containing protein n=1 Tax=Arctia plantaginis TaxID=874455 RepID=A0A8S0Z225_ARCPL|nr:unnamed protein product [Arctia plantaginis]